ncbi:hypothetical protein NE237_027707 [Protea cynaroides]|uniref:S-adenosyl-L-methionine-dependent methyltransferase n=1 Tax=Protea cynaroides TaxID=273540 RepID=A0A9Q0GR04_9MAGN|nr:hypothetical protein NE237_027707 [Protea cynaroides]
MACWSAENATKAYLRTLKMGTRGKEPDVAEAEFVSALAAGNSAQLMVEVCAGTAGTTTLALVAAAHQTGGRVVCVLPGLDELHASEDALGSNVDYVEFVIGDARRLLMNCYKGADFVLIDCNLEDNEGVFRAVQAGVKHGEAAVVMGYNAFGKGSWLRNGLKIQLLPIGGGLLVARIPAMVNKVEGNSAGANGARRSRWVVRVDKCTGEEHVYRIKSPQKKEVDLKNVGT